MQESPSDVLSLLLLHAHDRERAKYHKLNLDSKLKTNRRVTWFPITSNSSFNVGQRTSVWTIIDILQSIA